MIMIMTTLMIPINFIFIPVYRLQRNNILSNINCQAIVTKLYSRFKDNSIKSSQTHIDTVLVDTYKFSLLPWWQIIITIVNDVITGSRHSTNLVN